MATQSTAAQGAGTCVDAGGSALGMPQLCFDWWGNQIFWLLVTLVVIYFVLSRIALPRIAAVLAERQGTITNNIAAAEKLKKQAHEAEAAYNKALADARNEANRIVAETRAEIQADLDIAIAKADAEIAARIAESEQRLGAIRASALDAVRDVANDTTGAIVAAMGATADAKAVTAAVADRMKG